MSSGDVHSGNTLGSAATRRTGGDLYDRVDRMTGHKLQVKWQQEAGDGQRRRTAEMGGGRGRRRNWEGYREGIVWTRTCCN